MKPAGLFCAVAQSALVAVLVSAAAANAQVTVPLPGRSPAPQPAPAQAPVVVPLPGSPAQPADPLGPNGRPDINPYNRDIDMTVPMMFRARSLGDIGMRLTADDRFLLDTETFLKLARPLLNEPAQTRLEAALTGKRTFAPEDLAGTGVALTYDPATLAIVIIEIDAEQRAIEQLFAPRADDLAYEDLQPADFSAYLNLNLAQSYLWGSGEQQKPTVSMNGAARVGRVVFEGDGRIGNEFGANGETYRFTRGYARLVYDQAEDYRRWFLGDLDPETRGTQSFVRMGGVGVLRQRRRFNAFRSAILQSNRTLVLQRESTVRFVRNGVLYRQLQLLPGSYDFSAFPLIAGSNDVDIEVADETGQIQSLSYQQYLDPIDLEPGDHEYGAYFGPISRSFSASPSYDGPMVFTGFYRKAFIDKPALGLGLQLSEDVQTVTGQTQFVLPGGGRLLLDAGASRSRATGAGYAGGIAYDLFLDRGGLSDSVSIRADWVSRDYANINDPLAFNTIKATLNGQFTHQFTQRFLASLSGSYRLSRRASNDSYRLGAAGYYRLTDRFTVRAGVDYVKTPALLGAGGGFSANIALVFQPDYRRRAEARYESRENSAELSYNQSGLNELDSLGFGAVLGYQDGSARAQAYADYSANRFNAGISHSSFGPSLSDFGQLNVTSARVGTTIAYADGMFGVGRRINDSFILLDGHANLGGRRVVAGQSLARNDYIGRSGGFGAALNNSLGSYAVQSVQYDVEDAPTGYDIGSGVLRIRPPYRSGYAYRVGTDAFVSAIGTLQRAGEPVSLVGGRITLLDVKPGENPQPLPFFTNTVGRFAIGSLLPGRRYLVETYGAGGTTDRSFEFTVPADSDGLMDLGTVSSAAPK